MQLMLQATVCDCLALDPFAFEEDGLGASEVDVSRGKIVEALVMAGMVVMRDEGRDLAFEVAGRVVLLKQDAVLERLRFWCEAWAWRIFGGKLARDEPGQAC